MKQAIMFGAGNVGRGFLGQLFSESGYRVTFVDIDEPLLETMNERGRYTIRLVTNEATEEVKVGPVRALLATDQEAVAEAIAEADIGATAVGARVLEAIAPNLAAGIVRRADRDVKTPLNLIICENLKGAANILRGLVRDNLPASYHDYLAEHVGFVDTVIARMVPPLTPELRAEDPSLIIVEPYKELPVDADAFAGPPPDIVGMIPDRSFSFYTERKLYIHNAGHAVLAYLGYQGGYEYGYQALEDEEIDRAVRGAMTESQQALEKKYDLPPGRLADHVNDLLHRFRNRTLGDTIFRLGRDPVRKLGRSDRLVGAALNALSQQVEPNRLVDGIVAALRFDHPDDPIALELQQRLQQQGVDRVLQEMCGLESDSELARRIKRRYEER